MNLFSIQYNGITISSADYTIAATEMSGTQGVEVRTSSAVNSIFDGGQVYRQLSGMRIISLSFTFVGDDAAAYFAKQSQLLSAFSHSATNKNLVITRWDDVSKQIVAHVIAEPDVIELSGQTTINTTQVQLMCSDIYFTDSDLQAITLVAAVNGGVPLPAPIPFPIQQSGANDGVLINAGNAEWFPSIVLNGLLTSPSITNLTTGVSLSLATTILEGDSVAIYKENKSTFVIYNDVINYYQYFSGSLPLIAAGNNTLRLTTASASDTGNAVISYRSQYKGL